MKKVHIEKKEKIKLLVNNIIAICCLYIIFIGLKNGVFDFIKSTTPNSSWFTPDWQLLFLLHILLFGVLFIMFHLIKKKEELSAKDIFAYYGLSIISLAVALIYYMFLVGVSFSSDLILSIIALVYFGIIVVIMFYLDKVLNKIKNKIVK